MTSELQLLMLAALITGNFLSLSMTTRLGVDKLFVNCIMISIYNLRISDPKMRNHSLEGFRSCNIIWAAFSARA